MRFVFTFIIWSLSTAVAFAETNIQEITSKGGITVWLVDEPSIPFVALEVAFKGGASLDDADKMGATYLMTGLLEEGSGDMDASAFSRATEELAAGFGFDASRDSVSISARVLKENQDQSLALLKQALMQPTFSDVAFARVQNQVVSIVKSKQTDPQDIATRAMAALAYSNHPYSQSLEGTLETVTNLTAEDMRQAHKNIFAKDRLFVSVVGDIRAEEVGPMVDALLGDLPETGKALPQKTEFSASGGVTVVDFDTPQAVAIWAHDGMDRHDPDFFAAYLLNHTLGGGGLSSRLTAEVREKRGLTYGVYSYLAPFDYTNIYAGGVSSSNDRIKTALDVIKEEWRKMAEFGVTAEELEASKKYLTGAYPLRFDGNGRIANLLVGMQMSGYPIDYPKTRNDKINAVTLEDVNRVAKELLQPEAMRFVVVGKPEGLVNTD
ncbi:insulinase family protein [Amylibacter sp. SFDW26]|uniref:M16 family metallopeptidase n=1 Tax=Amylibacter sp. SFDW26 TaxID=2652722 RepID=UPI001262315F|nr:pitrilysin family protein [Amylibacter sp. SFDW26]KAB7614306.1 insulinase family protein [Amylibacter sp. SFDW26]